MTGVISRWKWISVGTGLTFEVTMRIHRRNPVFALLTILLAALLAFTSTAFARSSEGGTAHLFIKRAPDLGNLAYVAVRIDGRNAGGILWGQNYNRSIPAGRHVIEVQLEPAEHNYSPSSLVLDVHAGRTYSFQAMKKGGALVLGRF